MMGFSPENVGYLHYLAEKGYGINDLTHMELLGEHPELYRKQFKPHSWYEWQQKWADERVNKIIGL